MPKQQEFPFEAFLGGDVAPNEQAAKGMQRAEEEQDRRFQGRKQSQEEVGRAHAPLREAFGRLLGESAQEAVAGFQETEKRHARTKLSPPRPPKEQHRIFPGSIGITRVPPYNYQWTWNAKDAGAAIANVGANAAAGQESFYLYNNGVSAHAWGATAVGVYFRPMTAYGYVHLWSTPAFNYSWYTYSVLDSSHSDGWLGLYVGQYNLAGDLDRVPVNQQILLWNDNSWWSGAGFHSGSNSGYPLSAWFTVDSAHWYAMWVWSGGSVYGDGWGTFSGSAARSSLNVTVPSISIVLY